MASIDSYETAGGHRCRVRYRTPGPRQTDKRGFKTKREAEDFLATVEVSKMRGEWVGPTRRASPSTSGRRSGSTLSCT